MSDRISIMGGAFEHGDSFDAGDTHGGLRLGKFEAQYEELFAEVIEDGIITTEERARLDRAADLMGLDKGRLKRLEAALQSAFEAHHNVRIVVHGVNPAISYMDEDDEQRASLVPSLPAADTTVQALQKRIAMLETRVRELEQQLEEARNNVAVEVDLGGVAVTQQDDDPADLQRRIRQDPTDPEPMHALYRLMAQRGDLDRQWCVASTLAHLGKTNADERTVFEKHRTMQLPKFSAAVTADAWRRLLFHPDEEILTGDIFGVITGAVLLGRVSALRRDKQLPKLDPLQKQDVPASTISAVRAVGWAAAVLGLKSPPIYVDPALPIGIEMIPGIPPNIRVGQKLVTGRTPLEVAFECGRLLACFREEHFVRWLFPGIPDLEDLFLAALAVGNPSLPVPPQSKVRVGPIAAAIEPVLEASQIDQLRGYFLRFVEEGGRTNLQRWAHAVDKTACRAGLVLCNDLGTAGRVLCSEEKPNASPYAGADGDRMRDLVVFTVSDRYASLRRQLGVAITN